MESLPPEVLGDIFLRAVLLNSRFASEEPISLRKSIATPIHISHVCRTWRKISLSDGRVWSYLSIDSRSLGSTSFGDSSWPSKFKNHNIIDIFDTWIARSRSAPLNYYVSFYFCKLPPDRQVLKCAIHIVTTLMKQHHRWKDVAFNWEWLYDQIRPIVGVYDLMNMALLTSLRLECRRQSRFAVDLGKSTQLREVLIQGNFSILAPEKPLLLLKEPSRLSFRDGCTAADVVRSCQNFLSGAPFLEELHITFEDDLELPNSPLENIRPIYPGLRHLRLFSHQGSGILIDNVTLPSLRSLRYPCGGGQKLLRFLERSMPPLTYLQVRGLSSFEDTFIPCLRLLPSLEQLEISGVCVSARFFRELVVPSDGTSPVVCPALEALALRNLDCLGDTDACAEAIISMLESRAEIMPVFRRVQFYAPGDENVQIIETFNLREYDFGMEGTFFVGLTVGKTKNPFNHVHYKYI